MIATIYTASKLESAFKERLRGIEVVGRCECGGEIIRVTVAGQLIAPSCPDCLAKPIENEIRNEIKSLSDMLRRQKEYAEQRRQCQEVQNEEGRQ